MKWYMIGMSCLAFAIFGSQALMDYNNKECVKYGFEIKASPENIERFCK